MIAAIMQRKTSDLRTVKATVWTVLTAFMCLFFLSQQRLATSISKTDAQNVLNRKMLLRIHPAQVLLPSGFHWLFLTENFEVFGSTVDTHQVLLAELRGRCARQYRESP